MDKVSRDARLVRPETAVVTNKIAVHPAHRDPPAVPAPMAKWEPTATRVHLAHRESRSQSIIRLKITAGLARLVRKENADPRAEQAVADPRDHSEPRANKATMAMLALRVPLDQPVPPVDVAGTAKKDPPAITPKMEARDRTAPLATLDQLAQLEVRERKVLMPNQVRQAVQARLVPLATPATMAPKELQVQKEHPAALAKMPNTASAQGRRKLRRKCNLASVLSFDIPLFTFSALPYLCLCLLNKKVVAKTFNQ